ncbi:Kifc3 [Scenedesmus sp. PABB004]|nr:Kifc3 [Scenedesmus sp. PABB004]
MPPVFKRSKECAPGMLAGKAPLGGGADGGAARAGKSSSSPTAADRQLLVELGLADAADDDGAALLEGAPDDGDDDAGGIGAYYPAAAGGSSGGAGGGGGGGAARAAAALRARVDAAAPRLAAALGDAAAAEEVAELLVDQQHQIDLLLRGMGSLRRRSAGGAAAAAPPQAELERQHAAALRKMEGKLEKAISQVQLLQQATRDRAAAQEASAAQSLQAERREAAALRAQVAQLTAAAAAKEAALGAASELTQQLTAKMAALSAAQAAQAAELRAHESAEAAFRVQLAALSDACGAAQQDAGASVAVLAQAQQEVQALKREVHALNAQLLAAEREVQGQCDAIRAQHDAQDSAAAAVAAVSEQAAGRAAALAGRVAELEAAAAAAAADAADRQAGLQAQLGAAAAAQAELSARCEALEDAKLRLQAQCVHADGRLAASGEAAAAAAAAHAALAEQTAELRRQLADAEARHAAEREALRAEAAGLDADKAALSKAAAAAAGSAARRLEAELAAAARQAQDAAAELAAAKAEAQKQQWRASALQAEHQKAQRAAAEQARGLQEALDGATAQLAAARGDADRRVAEAAAAAAAQVAAITAKWRDEYERRRKLHDQVVELKGNIRVIARVRPMLEKEHATGGSADPAVRPLDADTVCVALPGAPPREYEFDRVLGPGDSQAQVFDEVSGLVTSSLDGFNACILAYGQTGSGKTHTIEGPPADPGVNSRALAELFRAAAERKGQVTYSLSASVLEIYNEQIIDLLAGSKDSGDKLDVKEGPGGLFVPGLRVEPVLACEDVGALLQKAKQHRSTFATNMNEHSSRSHQVLTVYIAATDLVKGASWASRLHLIDLAGSERVSRSGAEGERLREAAAINRSLSALGDVVAALQARAAHVPYRNSKLTRLLEDSLGGSAKTLVVCCVSPAAENAGESRCSLEFAARARKVELGAARSSATGGGSPAAGGSPAGSSGGGSPRLGLTATARLAASRRAGGLAHSSAARRKMQLAASRPGLARPAPRSRAVMVHAANSSLPGAKVERWLQTPWDFATFGARAAFGALISLPERLQTLPTDVERVSALVQDPRPAEEKQQIVLQEVEDTLVTFLERGAGVEADILANLKVVLPPDVVAQLDGLIPPPPSNNAPPPPVPEEDGGEPAVIYTADAVLENQIASEMSEIKVAVSGVKAALEGLRANADPARAGMLRLNLREARDILARRLQETAPGAAPAGTSSDASLAAATREASVLLEEVNAQFFS